MGQIKNIKLHIVTDIKIDVVKREVQDAHRRYQERSPL